MAAAGRDPHAPRGRMGHRARGTTWSGGGHRFRWGAARAGRSADRSCNLRRSPVAGVMANPKSQIPNSKSQAADGSRIPDPGFPPEGDYCRDLESYLCRKNDGHLIRIVGPAFEQVCGWAARGIPLKLAMRGIDRYFDRYYAKGARRRPVRIEFCEADVLDVFDEWRRSVGVSIGAGKAGEAAEGGQESGAHLSGPRSSLPAHLERVIARLTTLRGGTDRTLDQILDIRIRELDAARARATSI